MGKFTDYFVTSLLISFFILWQSSLILLDECGGKQRGQDITDWNVSRSWDFISHHGEDELVGKGQMRWSKVDINTWDGSTIYHAAIIHIYTISLHPSCPRIWLHCLYMQKDRMNHRKRHKLVNMCLLFLTLIFSWVSNAYLHWVTG